MQFCCVNYIRIIPKITRLSFTVYMFLSSLNYGVKIHTRRKDNCDCFWVPGISRFAPTFFYVCVFKHLSYWVPPFWSGSFFTYTIVAWWILCFEGNKHQITESELEGERALGSTLASQPFSQAGVPPWQEVLQECIHFWSELWQQLKGS